MRVSSRIYLTTEEVAATTKLSQRQVLALIATGVLPSRKVGRLHLIHPLDVKKVKARPGMGRPKVERNRKKVKTVKKVNRASKKR